MEECFDTVLGSGCVFRQRLCVPCYASGTAQWKANWSQSMAVKVLDGCKDVQGISKVCEGRANQYQRKHTTR